MTYIVAEPCIDISEGAAVIDPLVEQYATEHDVHNEPLQ